MEKDTQLEKYIKGLGDPKSPRFRKVEKETKLFIEEYVQSGNATATVKKVFEITTPSQASYMLQKMLRNRDVRDVIRLYAHRAVHRVEMLAENARSEKVRLEANQDILDRAGVLPPIAAPPPLASLTVVLPPAIAQKNGITPSTIIDD